MTGRVECASLSQPWRGGVSNECSGMLDGLVKECGFDGGGETTQGIGEVLLDVS
jgi:hypothetical protein